MCVCVCVCEREREREREREMRKETTELKDNIRALLNGDISENSKFSSLLASKDRDYLISPNGNQVFFFFIY